MPDQEPQGKRGIAGVIAALLIAAGAGGVAVTDAFLRADAPVTVSEGGYINHAADPGGATRYGITVAVARAWGYEGPMSELPLSVAVAIRKDYFERVWGDSVASVYPAVAMRLHDGAINAGPVASVKWLQRCLNQFNRRGRDYRDVGVDGAMGPRTLRALRMFAKGRGGAGTEGERRFYACHVVRQGGLYNALASGNADDELFAFGWYERVPIPLPETIPDSTLDSIRTSITYPTD